MKPSYFVGAHHRGAGINISFIFNDTNFYKDDALPLHASTQEVELAEWTGRDQQGCLIYSFEGRLVHLPQISTEPICLADFNDLMPNPEPSPSSAHPPPN